MSGIILIFLAVAAIILIAQLIIQAVHAPKPKSDPYYTSTLKSSDVKLCKHCYSRIDANARVCPVCGKRQNSLLWIILLIAVLVILSCALIVILL